MVFEGVNTEATKVDGGKEVDGSKDNGGKDEVDKCNTVDRF